MQMTVREIMELHRSIRWQRTGKKEPKLYTRATTHTQPHSNMWKRFLFCRSANSEPFKSTESNSCRSRATEDSFFYDVLSIEPTEEAFLTSSLKVKTQQQSLQQTYSSDKSSLSESKSSAKSVAFDTVDFRFHARTLGDQLGASGGPPIAISWESIGSESMSVDHYEATKPLSRDVAELVLSRGYRLEILEHLGFPAHIVRKAESECIQWNEQRRKNIQKFLKKRKRVPLTA